MNGRGRQDGGGGRRCLLRWRWSERQQPSEWRWGKEMFLTSSYRKKIEEREQWAREEKERTTREEEEDAKLRKRRGGMAMGSPMLGVVGEELAPGWGRQRYCDRGGSYVDGKGGSTDEELADC